MTKEEILEWIESANYVEAFWHEHDDCGNYYADEIFEKDGKLFKIPFSNGEVSTFWSEEKNHYYDIVPVVKKERMEYYYEEE